MGQGCVMKKLLVIMLCLMAVNQPAEAKLHINKPIRHTVDVRAEMLNKLAREKMHHAVRQAVRQAQKTPYVFSGSTPRGWDCSGMVRWIYEQAGVTLPHSADEQAHLGDRVSQPKYGDIVVFAYAGRKDFYHAAIYLGQGLILNANREYGTTVIEPITNFKQSQIRFVRVL